MLPLLLVEVEFPPPFIEDAASSILLPLPVELPVPRVATIAHIFIVGSISQTIGYMISDNKIACFIFGPPIAIGNELKNKAPSPAIIVVT